MKESLMRRQLGRDLNRKTRSVNIWKDVFPWGNNPLLFQGWERGLLLQQLNKAKIWTAEKQWQPRRSKIGDKADIREGRPSGKGTLHRWCARNLLRNPLLNTSFAVFTRAALENRTDCAQPRVGIGSTDNSPPCWFLPLPLCHLLISAGVCSRADCSCLSGNPAVWLPRTF